MTEYSRSKRYQEARRTLLADHPVCHWCKQRPATTADHVIELDRGGTHDIENMVPACRPCNSSRGASYGNAKRGAGAPKVAKAPSTAPRPRKATTPPVFGRVNPDPEPPSNVYVAEKRPRKPKAAPKEPEVDRPVEIEPRFETPVLGSETYGPQVADWARKFLQVELMPWQVRALSGQLAHDGGKLSSRLSLVSVARQNGKSVALKALVGWWLTVMPVLRGEPQIVITTAHALDLATALFQELAPVLETHFGAEAKWSYGRSELMLPDGSHWLVRAATPSAGHGRSPSLVVADELWNIAPEVIEQGLIPAQRAKRSPLCSMWSTAGTEASEAMSRFREQGIQQIDAGTAGGLYFAEWSPAEGANLTDPATWAAANPALGHTLELETLIAESKTPNQSAFKRASLNLWVSSDRAWLDAQTWADAYEPTATNPPTVIALDSSRSGDRYVAVVARPLPGGEPSRPRVRLELAFAVQSELDAWARLDELVGPNVQVALTPGLYNRSPARLERLRVQVGEQEIRQWTSIVGGLITDRRVCHDGGVLLTEHFCRAVAVTSGSGITVSSQRSPGPIEIARCGIWAAALATKPQRSGRAAVVLARPR